MTMIFSVIVISGIAYASEVNLLVDAIPTYWVGRVMTILAAAGGSGGLHDMISSVRSEVL